MQKIMSDRVTYSQWHSSNAVMWLYFCLSTAYYAHDSSSFNLSYS